MKILFATSECMPFVKTGGIADVMGALPREILATLPPPAPSPLPSKPDLRSWFPNTSKKAK